MIALSRLSAALLIPFALALLAHGASAQSEAEIVIGIAAPLSGPSELLGRQVVAGAATAIPPGSAGIRRIEADTGCTADGGTQAARRFIDEKVAVVTGFLCTAAIEGALPFLRQAGIPVINVGVRADRIMKRREREDALIWRIAPGSDAEALALARFVTERWRDVPVGIVEDGSAYGRDLADSVREILERDGFKPSFVDNYRPAEEKQFALARRIQQSGVDHILVFGARPDLAIITRDAMELGLDLTIASGESVVDEQVIETILPPGIIAIASGFDVDWATAETPPSNEGYATVAKIGTEIAVQAVHRSRQTGQLLSEIFDGETFATSGGLVRFGADASADVVPFRAYRWDGQRFVLDGEG